MKHTESPSCVAPQQGGVGRGCAKWLAMSDKRDTDAVGAAIAGPRRGSASEAAQTSVHDWPTAARCPSWAESLLAQHCSQLGQGCWCWESTHLREQSQLRPHPWSFCSINLGLATHHPPPAPRPPATESTVAEGGNPASYLPYPSLGIQLLPLHLHPAPSPTKVTCFLVVFTVLCSFLLLRVSSLVVWWASIVARLYSFPSALGEIPFTLQM